MPARREQAPAGSLGRPSPRSTDSRSDTVLPASDRAAAAPFGPLADSWSSRSSPPSPPSPPSPVDSPSSASS